MAQLSFLDEPEELPPEARRLTPKLERLAEQGVRFGTSSWKYAGWLGSIYPKEKYTKGGKFQEKAFNEGCLEDYARVFPAAGGDFSFYTFPTDAFWRKLFGETPDRLFFCLKVPEHVTVPTWPGHARYGTRAGKPNEHFLDAEVFTRLFARPLMPYAHRIGALMFEFGAFSKKSFGTAEQFVERLGPFLAALPGDFRYGVEVRNPELLDEPGYFTTLADHNVAHVFNAWTRMPELADQIARVDAFTANFLVARALLKKGRAYEQAVKLFEPYEEVQEPDVRGREALRQLAEHGRQRKKPAFLLVNNRYEGHAPGTIEAVADSL